MKSRRCFKEILISTNSSEFAKRNENVRYNRRLKACLFEEVFISINSFGNLEEMTLANCEPGFKNISLPVECIGAFIESTSHQRVFISIKFSLQDYLPEGTQKYKRRSEDHVSTSKIISRLS